MLVMRMSRGQRVMIGNVTVYIAGVGDSTVRLAIDAAQEVPIIREEAINPTSELPEAHRRISEIDGGLLTGQHKSGGQ